MGTGSDRDSAAAPPSSALALKTALLIGLASGIVALPVAFFGSFNSGWIAAAAIGASIIAAYLVVELLILRRIRAVSNLASSLKALGAPLEEEAQIGGDEIDGLTATLKDTQASVRERISRLRRIENYRQEFLGDVSHELQTPIFAVEGFAETLLEGALEDPSVNRSFVEKIHRNARRLSALVNDLSDISQIETGSLRMNLLPFDPKQLAQESIEALEMSAEQSGVQLHSFIGRNVGQATGDRERIRQVLLNLLTNGIKYNNPGGSVELAIWQAGPDEITFSITDDGIGIEKEEVARVTERFYRVDKSRSRERGGTGLGLAIVKHIVEAHGSSLQIQSRPGHGSTFAFTLPIAPGVSKTESTPDHP